jgi:hypothetical protein
VRRHEKEIELNFKIGRGTLAKLHEIAKTLNTKSYENVFYEVLRNFSKNANYHEMKELRKKNEDLERKLKAVIDLLKT